MAIGDLGSNPAIIINKMTQSYENGPTDCGPRYDKQIAKVLSSGCVSIDEIIDALQRRAT